MPYDPELEERIDHRVADWPQHEKKAMFGGIGYLVGGHMAVGIWHDSLVVRCGPARYAELLERDGAAEFDITGRPMKGWLLIAPEGFRTPAALAAWLHIAHTFASSLPPKD